MAKLPNLPNVTQTLLIVAELKPCCSYAEDT